MIGVIVYHQIKTLCQDHSLRDTAEELRLSVNTVRKYEALALSAASANFEGRQRSSRFGVAREFIAEQLAHFPKISSVKLLRQVKERYPDVTGKVRAFRDYLKPLRVLISPDRIRHFEPVLDMAPGHQIQVDGGEMRVVRTDGGEFKVYFIVFVFSYSRRLYVHFQGCPYDTDAFIAAHRQAFVYFGGAAHESVYDQTKMVVINERYREVLLNERFHQFATGHDFGVRVCEGYDPQSKGKVERSVGYVKDSFLYGEYFADIRTVQARALDWLNEVANVRIHEVTQRRPIDLFEDERPLLRQRYAVVERSTRQVDKTGLLSFAGNKYSAPFVYQRKEVAVESSGETLILRDPDSGQEVARHAIPAERGRIVKNSNHYRDFRKSVSDLTAAAQADLHPLPASDELIARVKADNPKIVRDQLRGLTMLSSRFAAEIWTAALPLILQLPQVSARRIETILTDYARRQLLEKIKTVAAELPETSCLDRPLTYYQEAAHA